MDYKVISQIDKVSLERAVTEHLNGGWELNGGIFIIRDGHTTWYYQSIIIK